MNMEISSGVRAPGGNNTLADSEHIDPNTPVPFPSGVMATDGDELAVFQSAYQSLTSSSNSPTNNIPPPVSSGTPANQESALEKLSSDNALSTDLYSIMMLLQKCGQEMRDTARIERDSELQAQISALDSAAEQMKVAADWKLAAGIVQGVATMGSGLAQAASGLTQMGASAGAGLAGLKGIGSDGKISDTADQTSRLISGLGTGFSQIQGAGGTLISGGGNAISSILTYQADLAEVEKTRLETDAKEHEVAVQHANDWMQEMMEVIRDVKDNAKTVNQMNHDSISGITSNI